MVYNYQILQLKNVPENHFYCFMSLDSLKKHNLEFSLDRYRVVYCDTIDTDCLNIHEFLESMFTKFNINHPKDFRGHSLSVSDVVYINNGYWFCDDFGWKKIS